MLTNFICACALAGAISCNACAVPKVAPHYAYSSPTLDNPDYSYSTDFEYTEGIDIPLTVVNKNTGANLDFIHIHWNYHYELTAHTFITETNSYFSVHLIGGAGGGDFVESSLVNDINLYTFDDTYIEDFKYSPYTDTLQFKFTAIVNDDYDYLLRFSYILNGTSYVRDTWSYLLVDDMPYIAYLNSLGYDFHIPQFTFSTNLNLQFRDLMFGLSNGGTYNYGYIQGYIDGEVSGNNNGYIRGYNDGYDDALVADETAFTIFNGILNVALVPINVFLGIFNFEVLGINISQLVSALLSVAVVIVVIRMVTGKGGGDSGQ